jgi:hypothetical protein
MALDPVTAALEVGKTLADKFWPDAGEKEKRDMELYLTTYNAQVGIITAEANSEHWLAACWRPILMLTFGGLIVARWFGWAAPELSQDEYLKLWDIVQLGIGGYTIGRTGEKIASTVGEVMKAKR